MITSFNIYANMKITMGIPMYSYNYRMVCIAMEGNLFIYIV